MKREDIEHLAHLARIELREGEADQLAEDITSIVSYVSEIESIGGGTVHKEVGRHHNVFREDVETHEPGAYTKALVHEMPERHEQYLKVKKIIGDKT